MAIQDPIQVPMWRCSDAESSALTISTLSQCGEGVASFWILRSMARQIRKAHPDTLPGD